MSQNALQTDAGGYVTLLDKDDKEVKIHAVDARELLAQEDSGYSLPGVVEEVEEEVDETETDTDTDPDEEEGEVDSDDEGSGE